MESLFKKRKKQLEVFFLSRKKNRQVKKKEIPEHVFKQCENCQQSISYLELSQTFYVCPKCGHHIRLSARERIRQLCDENSFKEIDKHITSVNVDGFEGYDEKLKTYQRKTGMYEALIGGYAQINGHKVMIAVMDSHFMMGSMGHVVGEKLCRIIELATKKKLPLLVATTSGGARMQEGITSLMQMAKTSAAIKRHHNEGLLYIVLLTDPTTGGVSASFAMLGDIILAEPNALVGFAGKRVIEKTIGEKLPKEFQRSEFLLEKGFIDKIVERKDLKHVITNILKIHEVK